MSVAAALVALPAELLTVAVNEVPLSVLVVDGVVYVEAMAPEIETPFFFH